MAEPSTIGAEPVSSEQAGTAQARPEPGDAGQARAGQDASAPGGTDATIAQDAFVVLADGTKLTLGAAPRLLDDGRWELAIASGSSVVIDADLWLAETVQPMPAGTVVSPRHLLADVVLPDRGRIEGQLLSAHIESDLTWLSWQRNGRECSVRISNAALAKLEMALRPPGVPPLRAFAARDNVPPQPEAGREVDVEAGVTGFAIVGIGVVVPSDTAPQQLSDGSWHLSTAGKSRLVSPDELWLLETEVPPAGEMVSLGVPLPTTVVLPNGFRLQGELTGAHLDAGGVRLCWRRNGRSLTLHVAAHALASVVYTMQPPHRVAPRDPADPHQRVPLLRNNADLDAYLAAHLQGQTRVVENHLLSDFAAWQHAVGESPSTEETFRLAQRLGLALIDLHQLDISPSAVAVVPPQLVRRVRMVPVRLRQGVLAVVTDRPQDADAQSSVEFATGLRVLPLLAPTSAIEAALGRQIDSVEDAALLQSLEIVHTEAGDDGELTARENERLARQKPVVGLVTSLIEDAVRRRASDIHVRPRADDFEVLFRIDGALVPVRTFAKPLLRAVVSRIKVVGGMDIAEHRMPQDGRVTVTVGAAQIDLRISVLPSSYGESVVLRLLNVSSGLRDIAEIGFSARDEEVFRDILARSNGLLLVTGPTGCGKSTTLYSALMEVRKQNVNIITVENPVEYHIPGVTQVQVQHDIGLDFARILRNILRHDPNVIMIGEIRDHETAEIAVECALTGHVVLSTLHTNSAATTITRLLDLGVESFLLSSTLLGVLAQRLARRNCRHCLEPEKVAPFVRTALGVGAEETFFRGIGCPQCNSSGVHGRLAVHELMPVTADIRKLIRPNADGDAIYAAAVANGMVPITARGIELARAGTISLAEAYRIRVE
ncbi:MAG: type II/IV secretion system protein [Nevskia sp.]|nr:type II/IV secretion system protein [Nevskia sp.]